MKRVSRLLIRLYPAWWRDRYGKELEALVEDSGSRNVWDFFRGAMEMQIMKTWSFGRIVTVFGLAGLALSTIAILQMPYRYQSTAMLKSEGNRSPEDWNALSRAAFSTQALSDIISQEHLYSNAPIQDSIERLRRGIRMELASQDLAHVSFAYEDPGQAQRVSQDLVGRLIAANLATVGNPSGQVLRLEAPAGPPKKQIAKLGKASLGIPAGLLFGVILAWILRRRTPRTPGDSLHVS